MTLSVKIKLAALGFLAALIVTLAPAWLGYQYAHGDTGSAVAAAPTAAPAPPQLSDIPVVEKLWKSGAFLALGVLALYLGLTIWSKLDKKHAFYIATALGGVGLLVDAIRKGDTPTASALMTMLMTTGGIMVKGPHAA
jgi:sterol desaturase/sphingolipid hydroxylase (fatty acid hydroxylase superfamily)